MTCSRSPGANPGDKRPLDQEVAAPVEAEWAQVDEVGVVTWFVVVMVRSRSRS